ncbi:Zinc knuckle [Carex littledalei]|uniref:Zinc knuckle n=1 Tax=Carex littledalei TaxID=544730 RepID=A0A833RT76_9POAL|nr:Zinc knuckle [Carex littledalei]
MATRMAIRMAIYRKKKADVSRLTLTSTKTFPIPYATVAAYPPFLFPPQNPKRQPLSTFANPQRQPPQRNPSLANLQRQPQSGNPPYANSQRQTPSGNSPFANPQRQHPSGNPTFANPQRQPTITTFANLGETDPALKRNAKNTNCSTGINGNFIRPNIGVNTAAHSGFSPNKSKLMDEDGWILITRKRRVAKTINSGYKPKSKLTGHHANLFTLGRCFRCLQRGHKSMNCKDQRCCFNCKGTGHLFRNCKSLASSAGIKSTVNNNNKFMHGNKDEFQQPKEASGHPENPIREGGRSAQIHAPHPFCKSTNMATPTNWQTMQLQNPANIQNRINELRVYLPPREEMAEENQFLVRAAIVYAGPHYNDRRIPQRLSNALGRFFGVPHQHFRISEIDPSIGDFIVVFPSSIMRDDAVRMGVFALDRDAEVQLVEWNDELAMLHEPTTHRARIRLHGLPLQYWNKEDLSDLVAGFGYLVRVASFFDNGNHEILRILVACHNPENIPKNILVTDDPNSTIVQVELEGYLHRAGNIPPPPPPPNTGNPPPPPPPPPPPFSGPRGSNYDERRISRRQLPYNGSNRSNQEGRAGASSSNFSRRRPVQINGEHNNQLERQIRRSNGDENWVKGSSTSSWANMQSMLFFFMGAVIINAVISSKGKARPPASNQVVLINSVAESSGELATVSWSAARFLNAQNINTQRGTDFLQIQMGDGSVYEDMGPNLKASNEAIVEYNSASILGPEIYQIEDNHNTPTGQDYHIIDIDEEWLSFFNSPKGQEGKEEQSEPPTQGQQSPNRNEEVILQSQGQQSQGQQNQGPPTQGHQSQGQQSPTQGHQSPNRNEENKKRKSINTNSKNEEYLKTFDNLSAAQAEAVVLMAGIEIDMNLEKEIEKALKDDDNQGT